MKMAAGRTSKRQTAAYSRRSNPQSMYVYGNAVPKPEYTPEREPEKRRRDPQHTRRSRQIRQNQRKALKVNKGYVIFLTVAAVLALVICVNYVRLQSQITSRSRNITAMQEELADMNEENTTKYNTIMDSVNLEEVRDKAINELGMVYADKDQIVEYDNPNGDYVKQYEEIPDDGMLASSKDVQN